MDISAFIIAFVSAIAGFATGYIISLKSAKQQLLAAEKRAGEIIEDAGKDAENLKREKLLEVKDDLFKKKAALEEDFSRRREKLQNQERALKAREENIEKNLSRKLES